MSNSVPGNRQESRLRVGVIGAGPVGVAFAQALAGAGHLLVGISGTSDRSSEWVDAALPNVDVLSVPELLPGSDLVVLAIPADQIAKSVAGWANLGLFHPGQLVIHTAAEFGTSVLQPAKILGALPMAIHPAMRFGGTSLDLTRMRDSHFAVTADEALLPIALALTIEMGAEPVVITEDDRAKYAEAIAVATTFSALVVNQAIGLLKQINVTSSRELLANLLHSSVDRALAEGHQEIQPEDLLG